MIAKKYLIGGLFILSCSAASAAENCTIKPNKNITVSKTSGVEVPGTGGSITTRSVAGNIPCVPADDFKDGMRVTDKDGKVWVRVSEEALHMRSKYGIMTPDCIWSTGGDSKCTDTGWVDNIASKISAEELERLLEEAGQSRAYGTWVREESYPYEYAGTDDGRMDEQDGRLDGHDQDVADIREQDSQQDSRLDGIDQKNREQDNRLDGHDEDIAIIEAKDREQDARLDGIDQKNREQDNRLDGHDKEIDRLDRLAVKYVADEQGNPTNTVILTGDGTGSPVTISNVERGREKNDAVNVAQLQDTVGLLGGGAQVNADGSITGPRYNIGGKDYGDVGSAFDATNNRIDDLAGETAYQISRLDSKISDVRSEARAGIAGANAFAGLRFDDSPGSGSLAVAFGGFKDASAMAIGAGYTTIDGAFRLNAALNRSFSANSIGWNAGLNWTFN